MLDLDALPSAEGRKAAPAPSVRRKRPRRSLARLATGAGASAITLLVVLAAAVYVAGSAGWGRETLRQEAERALERLAGQDVFTTLGAARLSLDGSRLLGVTISDVRLGAAGAGASWIDAGAVRFGVEFLPLLQGEVALGSATIEDATIELAALKMPGEGDWTLPLRNEQGLLDPQKLPPAVFQALARVFSAINAPGTLALSNVSILLPSQGTEPSDLRIEQAELVANGTTLELTAAGMFAGRSWTMEGTATRPRPDGAGQALKLGLRSTAPTGQVGSAVTPVGDLALAITADAPIDGPQSLDVTVDLGPSSLDLGRRGVLEGEGKLTAKLKAGSPVLDLEHMSARVGRSTVQLSGTVGPAPSSTSSPVYAYQLTTHEASIAPMDSAEAPAMLQAAVKGSYDPQEVRLALAEIQGRTKEGSVLGSAAFTFVEGHAPGIQLALDVTNLAVAEAKQLWPWFTAGQAREWTLGHVSAGTVESGSIRFDVLPGRLGSGVPTTADESWGEFKVRDVAFRPLNSLPEVRGADGTIAYRAFDADIAVGEAGLTTASGLFLSARDSRLTLRDTHQSPVIGKLDLTLAGDAQGAAELVNLPPINAGSKLPFRSDEVSGSVEAQVLADIPLQNDIPRDQLDWQVALGFENLAVAKPLDGQMLTAAAGTAAIGPRGATIDAKGLLNNLPAELRIVEPFTPDGATRERKILLTLDDEARDRVAPGLSAIMSGPMVLAVDAATPEPKVDADLDGTKLDLSWIGWSKGPGVPARATFTLSKEDGATSIRDLTITGKTFSAVGSAALRDGKLSSVELDRVQLNRGDDLALELKHGRNGDYAVTVSGASFDARSVLKLVTGEAPKRRRGSRGRGTPVTITASLGGAIGFGGETLRDVKLTYRGGSRERGALTLDARTSSGAAVSIADSGGSARRVAIRSEDAGAVLRFLDVYPKMQGGAIAVVLEGEAEGPLSGRITAQNFTLVNEERLGSVVSRRAGEGTRSLSEAVQRDIDTTRVRFDRGAAQITKGEGFLSIANGVLRGPTIGATFQGTLFDARGFMDMTGTFMPAYGLNRLFGELPLIGAILGNGSDRGLIGVTFKLEGKARSPTLTVNPLSVIAPGIFRSIFEYDPAGGGTESNAAPRSVRSER